MTIDERIVDLENTILMAEDGLIPKNSYAIDRYKQEISWLKELKWWRSQELINIIDIPEYCKLDCERTHCETCDKTFSFCNEIMQIPKAEYRGNDK